MRSRWRGATRVQRGHQVILVVFYQLKLCKVMVKLYGFTKAMIDIDGCLKYDAQTENKATLPKI